MQGVGLMAIWFAGKTKVLDQLMVGAYMKKYND
jgi:hypothetical protein